MCKDSFFKRMVGRLKGNWHRWPRAIFRQLPVTCAVAVLPVPYNLVPPVASALGKTVSSARTEAKGSSLLLYYFKTVSRTLFGVSLRRFLEQGAKYTLASEWGISDEALQALGLVMIILSICLDALD